MKRAKKKKYIRLVAKNGKPKILKNDDPAHVDVSAPQGRSWRELLDEIPQPEHVQAIELALKKEYAAGDPASRMTKFSERADIEYRARTKNFEVVAQKRLHALDAREDENCERSRKLWAEVDKSDAIERFQHRKKIKKKNKSGERQSWFARTIGKMKPQDQAMMATLLSVGALVSTIGPSSLYQFLAERSDTYAQAPWLILPIAFIPIAAGVAVEIRTQNLETKEGQKRAESLIFSVGLVAFGAWLIGILDMANADTGEVGAGGFDIPDGLRVVAQIVLEVPIIASISGMILKILTGYTPDGDRPAEKRRVRRNVAQEHDTEIWRAQVLEREELQVAIEGYANDRKAYVMDECAHFASVCADHDKWNSN